MRRVPRCEEAARRRLEKGSDHKFTVRVCEVIVRSGEGVARIDVGFIRIHKRAPRTDEGRERDRKGPRGNARTFSANAKEAPPQCGKRKSLTYEEFRVARTCAPPRIGRVRKDIGSKPPRQPRRRKGISWPSHRKGDARKGTGRSRQCEGRSRENMHPAPARGGHARGDMLTIPRCEGRTPSRDLISRVSLAHVATPVHPAPARPMLASTSPPPWSRP